jgi:hypothetical protein
MVRTIKCKEGVLLYSNNLSFLNCLTVEDVLLETALLPLLIKGTLSA